MYTQPINDRWAGDLFFFHRKDYLAGVGGGQVNEQTLDNLCGDLNKGYLPLNPIGQNVEGVSYPL